MAALLSILLAYLLSSSAAQNNSEGDDSMPTVDLKSSNGFTSFFTSVNKGIQKEVADLKHPVEEVVVYVGSSQCSNVKRLAGVAYEQYEGEKEPDVNQLTLHFITNEYSVKYNINSAARLIPGERQYNPHQKLYIFIHGFTDDPSKGSFTTVRNALFASGEYNVLALDGSSLIRWLYLRSTTYVRFMGEKLGEVLAALVQSGVDPDQIHIIGHSLGAHISGFTGKQFNDLTGLQVGRISGLDPAGPCFSNVEEGYRLNATDAKFVDVIHTDGGVFGLTDPVGDVDYYPNDGSQQPECLLQTCSHSRAWELFAESVVNEEAFPAVRCASWDAFSKGDCESDISYMGLPSKPGTRGLYFLQTRGESPYSLGANGTRYTNDKGVVKTITSLFG